MSPAGARRAAQLFRELAELYEEEAGGPRPSPGPPGRPPPKPRRRRTVPPPPTEPVSDLDVAFARRELQRR